LLSISDLSQRYEIHRPAVLAVLDEHDIPMVQIGNAKCVREEDLMPVAPILEKLRQKARCRRRDAIAV
jgi:hypothetical protein